MNFYTNLLKNLDIAILEVISTSGGNEGKIIRDINSYYKLYKQATTTEKKDKVIEGYLRKSKRKNNGFIFFLNEFSIARTFDSDKRCEQVEFIFEQYLPCLEKEDISDIDMFAEKARLLNKKNSLEISAISKIAMVYMPNKYFPYDSTVRDALKKYLNELNIKINIKGSYKNFYKIANEVFYECENEIIKGIKSKNFLKKFPLNDKLVLERYEYLEQTCELLNIVNVDDLIARRAFDKMLMMLGNYHYCNLDVFKSELIDMEKLLYS
ncbi:hypothetical protein ACJDU8_24510 [Clostridium sp. WILCCON 0269]|uniref:Uncharacterized protein n=1 Tax=Candidatus Clostridium eludens TaxID=3381663 RepID=A0ABW8SSJ1_9CLOT